MSAKQQDDGLTTFERAQLALLERQVAATEANTAAIEKMRGQAAHPADISASMVKARERWADQDARPPERQIRRVGVRAQHCETLQGPVDVEVEAVFVERTHGSRAGQRICVLGDATPSGLIAATAPIDAEAMKAHASEIDFRRAKHGGEGIDRILFRMRSPNGTELFRPGVQHRVAMEIRIPIIRALVGKTYEEVSALVRWTDEEPAELTSAAAE